MPHVCPLSLSASSRRLPFSLALTTSPAPALAPWPLLCSISLGLSSSPALPPLPSPPLPSPPLRCDGGGPVSRSSIVTLSICRHLWCLAPR